jgi:branched-chain amino acid transport system permease protein
MATFATFIAWSLLNTVGLPYWVTFFLTMAIAGAIGLITYIAVIRPVERAPEFTSVMMTFGLFLIYNGLSASLWTADPKPFPTPLNGSPVHFLGAVVSRPYVSIFLVAVVLMVVLAALFRRTKVGLAMRAAAQNPAAARLVGVETTAMYALGWILASMVGAIAGMLVANVLLLSSSLMLNVLIFAFLAAIVGGLTSPTGAVVGGLLVGVLDTSAGQVSWIGSQLKTPVMLVLIIVVLLLRPQGLFGKRIQKKV